MSSSAAPSAPNVPENQFTLTLVYRRTDRWHQVVASHGASTDAERRRLGDELRAALREHPEVTVRGIYSAAGLRADADTVFWLLSEDVAELQAVAASVRRTTFGRCADLSWAFLGVARRPEFVGDHLAAFQLGKPALGWICVYPFVRTPEWYLLPVQERGRMLRAHGEMGHPFADVQSNGVQAFGLGDWEWLLHFEADRPERFTALIRELRAAEARRYTKVEIPFVVGRRVEAIEEALADLG